MPNIERLEAVLEHITLHPEDHNQEWWTCGTAACFAGWTTRLFALDAGYRWITNIPDFFGDQVWENPRGEEGMVPDAARELLDITEEQAKVLFDADNTLPMLQSIVKDLANTGDTRRWADYRREEAERDLKEMRERLAAVKEKRDGQH